MKFIYVKICDYFEYFFLSVLTKKYNIAVTDLVRYVFKATNLGKKHLSVPQLFRKRYMLLWEFLSFGNITNEYSGFTGWRENSINCVKIALLLHLWQWVKFPDF